MTVFSSPARVTSIRYVRVSFPGFEELGEVRGITGCTIEENLESSLKVSGSLDFEGETGLDGMDDMVRVYSTSEAGGASETVCHATLMVSMPASETREGAASGTADLSSVLKVLSDELTDAAPTIAAGAGTVAFAASVVSGVGLACVSDESTHEVSSSHTWDVGTPLLSVVNDCMGWAGFSSADVDGYGNVLLRRYVDPGDRSVAATLSDTETGDAHVIGARRVGREHDPSSVPNSSTVTLSAYGEEPVSATVRNDDPGSPFSTVSRGRVISVHTELDELDGTVADRALRALRDSMRVTDRYEVDSIWYPVSLGDVLALDYRRSGIDARCALVARSTEMTPMLRSRLTLRRNVDYFEATEVT